MDKTSKPAIRLDSVSKRFSLSLNRPRTMQDGFVQMFGQRSQIEPETESFWALRNVSFTVERGEMVGLIGTNGSGKSTLLKLISRILIPTEGNVTVNGRVAALLELGAGFHPDLTGRENIFLNGSLLGYSNRDIQHRIDEIVDFANIGPFINTPLRHYSSGMQVRLGFAIATLFDPDILLVDEVLAVGDARFQAKCLHRIQELCQQGTTILFVSHDLAAVRKNCKRAALLEQGQLGAIGPTEETISAYLARVWSENTPLPVVTTIQDETETRWGTYEIQINAVSLHDQDGTRQQNFCTGDIMHIEMDVIAHTAVDRPVFGLMILGEDEQQIGESKIRWERECSPGVHQVTCDLELSLLPAKYHLTATIYDEYLVHPYDHRQRMLSFRVRSSNFPEEHGIVRFNGQWHHTPGS